MSQAAVLLVWAIAALVPYAFLQARFLSRLLKVPEVLGVAGGSASASASGSPRGDPGSWRRYVARRVAASVAGGVFWIACALASAGALRLPRYVSEPVLGAEIAFVVDASNSMLTADGQGSRLEQAREFAARLAATADGASLSVVAFRGRPATLCPPTRDRRAFEEALRWAGPTVTSSAGSDVGSAIDEATRPAFRAGTARVVVVFSDGNDTGGEARAAAARAASAGATLAFVGFGGPRDVPVIDVEGRPVSGRDGQPVLTSLDESDLRDWAASGHGLFVRADDPGAFAQVAAICNGAAMSLGKRRDVRVEVDAAPALAFVAMAALGLALVLSAPQHSRIARPEAQPSRRRRGKTSA